MSKKKKNYAINEEAFYTFASYDKEIITFSLWGLSPFDNRFHKIGRSHTNPVDLFNFAIKHLNETEKDIELYKICSKVYVGGYLVCNINESLRDWLKNFHEVYYPDTSYITELEEGEI